MQISLSNTGKRYNRDWIFRRLNYTFEPGKTYAITGSNGSGKSTLLQVIAGATLHSEGTICYSQNGNKTAAEDVFENISFAAPYLDLVEEMTATEMLQFHSGFKQLVKPIPEILETVTLQNAAHKQIRYYSSGMKQRLKLAQAFFSNSPLLLLDEPTTNLDADGVLLYRKLVTEFTQNRLVIVSSNVKNEYDFCEAVISIMDYK